MRRDRTRHARSGHLPRSLSPQHADSKVPASAVHDSRYTMSTSPSPLLPVTVVGRERELGILREHLATALAGQGKLVLISGEAGVGKTALASTVCAAGAAAGALVLTGHCY